MNQAPPRFRDATDTDLAAAHALIESGYRGDSAKKGWTHEADLLGGQRTDLHALAEIVADPLQALIVAQQGGDLIGCVHVIDKGMRADARVGYFGLLTVRPTMQGAGLGRLLIEAAERRARDGFGASVMEMTVIKQRQELIAWYLRRGYYLTGREEPFPMADPRFGIPKTNDLVFVVLAKPL